MIDNEGRLQVKRIFWDTNTQDCIANLSLSDSQIAAVAFTRDGKLAALGSGGKLVQIWNVELGKCTGTIYFSQGLENACEKAMEQIKERRYDEKLRLDGRTQIKAYGIAFCKKRCCVLCENL